MKFVCFGILVFVWVGSYASKDIRLQDGPYDHTGRLEIKINNEWGTVCSEGFNDNAAIVACRMLGYSGKTIHRPEVFYPSDGQIWFDDVACFGTESSLLDCGHGEIGMHNCTHDQDVHLSCKEYVEDIRLVGGKPEEGRVELKIRGEWGTICDDAFSSAEATVLCRMMGSSGPGIYSSRKYPSAPQRIWLDSLVCTGKELSILDCGRSPLGVHNCNQNEEVSIWCIDGVKEPPRSDTSL